MPKDYYEILNVSKYCTQEEIKKAYKKMALKFHPDKNGDDEESKNKFQDISEAYSILNDDTKRKSYDMFGSDEGGFHFENNGKDPFAMFNSIFKDHLNNFKNFEMNYENTFDIGNVINQLAGGGGLANLFSQSIHNVPNVHVKVHSFDQNNDILKNLFQQENNENNENNEIDEKIDEVIEDIQISVDVSMKDIYEKKIEKISYTKDKIKKNKIIEKKVNCEVPLYHNEIILKGNGNETFYGKGNVIIDFHCERSDFIRVNSFDVFYEKKLELKEYYKNKSCSIYLPNNEKIFLKDLKGNSLYKIVNKGIPYQEDEEWTYGDLYVNIKIVLPELDELYENVNELIEEETIETTETTEITETTETNSYVEVKWEHIFQE